MPYFFSPARAVLSAILRDEYLTSAVRTKEGDKAGSNQPPARDLVHFKLQLTPDFLISYLENTSCRSTRCRSPYLSRVRAQSFQNFTRKATLKLQDQLSRHHRCKILDQKHLRYACQSKSTNQRVSSKPPSLPRTGFYNGRNTLIGEFGSTRVPQMRSMSQWRKQVIKC